MRDRNITFEEDLRRDLFAQLCCAFEEYAEQVAENDDSNNETMKAVERVDYDANTCAVRAKDGSLHLFRFQLERL